ncbi:MAG: LysM peptidoglycan-binding domain-containing protein [Desulfobacteraceae bacterium]|nr:LysM peptidoglycan-binding domain-containing protein [Desulfobacteraceae bacterium]
MKPLNLLALLIIVIIVSGCSFFPFKNVPGHNNPVNTQNGLSHTKSDELATSDNHADPQISETMPLDAISSDQLLVNNEEPDSQTSLTDQYRLDEALNFCEVAQSFWQKGELDSALESLDKAYSLILDINTGKDAELIQQKEDLRFLISKRILEIYASRNIVVNGDHDEIPFKINRHVQAELKRFTSSEKKFFIESYKRSGLYRPYILEALKEAGMPEELSWLPLIESGFKVNALSSARALGLWQFMASTGYKFGLKRNRYIDERIDFEKATKAAIAYLKELHSIFGDWATVLAAYNCGEGRLLRLIRTQQVNYLDNFWDLYERLPRETARFVPRFYATLLMVKNPVKYGLDKIECYSPVKSEKITINRQIHLNDISQSIGVPLSELVALNPELRYKLLPPEPYHLRIPEIKKKIFLAKIDKIPTSRLPQRNYVWHRVKRGQTLGSIAKRYRVSVNSIIRANNIRRSNFIRIGQRVKIPRNGYLAVKKTPSSKSGSTYGIHRVRKGDSLWILANRYGTTVQQIRSANGLRSNNLSINQKLKIPGAKNEPLPDKNQLNVYLVKRGDSPYTIARKHKMALERLLLINKMHPRSKIFPGQKLYIE